MPAAVPSLEGILVVKHSETELPPKRCNLTHALGKHQISGAAHPLDRSGLRAVDLALIGCGAVASALIAIGVDGPVRTIITFLVWSLLPGWAIVRRLRVADPVSRLALSVVAGIVVIALVSMAMVWTHIWHPNVVAIVVILISSSSLLYPLHMQTPSGAAVSSDESNVVAPGGPVRTRALFDRRAIVGWIVLLTALTLWFVSIALTHVNELGDWGLLPVFPVIWYVAVAIVFGVCLFGLAATPIDGRQIGAALAALVIMLNASANMIEDAPRLPWVYKHIAVTRYIDAYGSVDPSIDLYHRWPGFFSYAALFGQVIGHPNPVDYAAWAETVFPLIDLVLVLAVARAIWRNPGWYWTAAIVFTISDWVGQNYFSPQAFSFTLYLAISLVVITYLRREPRDAGKWLERLLTRRKLRLARPATEAQRSEIVLQRSPVVAVVAVLLLQAVIVASHQLTPYMVILALLPLFILGYLRPTWLGFAVFAIAVVYLLPNLSYVQEHWGLFSSFDPVANATYPTVDPSQLTSASIWQGRGVSALSVLTALLALAGFVRRIWFGHVRTTLIVAWLAFAPVLTLLGQTYGGEGKFRVFLFGLPWYAMGVAWLFWSEQARTRRSLGACTAALTVMLLLFVATYYQPEMNLRTPASDVAAAEWIDQNAESGDTMLTMVATQFPVIIGPRYYLLNGGGPYPTLDGYEQSLGEQRSAPLADVEALFDTQGAANDRNFLVFSESQDEYAVAHGLFAPAALDSLEQQIAHDPQFSSVYDNGSVRIYRYK